MAASFEQVIKISVSSYTRSRALLPKKLGNEAINHFKDNWRKQGFDDSTVKPWAIRKGQLRAFNLRKSSNNSRAILVKTGRLRRDWSNIVEGVNRTRVVNNTPYGAYHNYGTNRMKQRKFMGESRNLNEKFGVIISRMIKGALR